MTSRRALLVAAGGAVALLGALGIAAPDALAHGLVGREDLPVPKQWFFFGATAVLVVSFAGLATLWQTPQLEGDRPERRVAGFPAVFEVLLGMVGVAWFGILVWAGLAGEQSSTANIVPTAVHVLFWVGVPVLSVLFGDVFRALNPWRAIGRGAGWLAGRVAAGRLPEPLAYPERLGIWPALAGLFAFGWIENVYLQRDDPSTLAILAIAYAAIQLVGMSLYGVETWTRRGDGFGVYFRLYGLISPLDWRDRALYLRRPLSGLTQIDPLPGLVAFVITAIGITTFDGLSEGPLWTDIAPDIQRRVEDIGLNVSRAAEVTYTIGLVSTILLIFLVFRFGVAGMRNVDDTRSATELARTFAHSFVPIAFAYVLAHYFSFLAYQGQAIGYLASDPLGDGSDLFGTADKTIDYGVISANGIWYVQVVSLVVGHVAALILAHDRALKLYRDPQQATNSQYWMLAVMVSFTTLGLYLLSEANA